jgi:hypothetical protein
MKIEISNFLPHIIMVIKIFRQVNLTKITNINNNKENSSLAVTVNRIISHFCFDDSAAKYILNIIKYYIFF